MKKYLLFFLSAVLLFASCTKHQDEYYSFEDEPFDESSAPGDFNQDGDNLDSEEGALTLYKVSGNQIDKVKDYNVPSRLQTFQDDIGKHQKMWEFTTQLIPLEDRDKIAEFEVFHGEGDLLGYVLPVNDNDLSKWRFGLAIDAAENLNTIDLSDLFTFVTIHEYGHVLTLNDEQINVTGENNCNTYFTGEGCSTSTSYINQLFKLGWSDIINQHNENNPDKTYNKYQDRFVSDYAATNPGEDIAEVFSFFVINNSAPIGNSIAEQKINLMYTFPELTELRDKIRSNSNAARMDASRLSRKLDGFRICKRKKCNHTK